MLEITLIQDLSGKNLREVPRHVLNLTNLKMLYLEGNDLETIPQELFILLNKLQWLDLRNNKLTTLPKTVMDHQSLETLLLQNNDIEILPLELGYVPNLKVLQLSGNPIKFPEKKILECGVPLLQKFLRKEYIAKEKGSINEEDEEQGEEEEVFEMAESDKVKQSTSGDKSTSTEDDSIRSEPPIITLKSYHRFGNKKIKQKCSTATYRTKAKDTPYSNSNRYTSSCPTSRNDKRLQDQMLKDLFLNKMKDFITQQEHIIQKEKDKEAIRKWRYCSKYKHGNPDVNYRPIMPFDYDKEYDIMPSRSDINRFIEKNTPHLKHYKPRQINIQHLISEIVESLRSMEYERDVRQTPRTRMNYAGREIKRILDLQRRLSALKITNDRTL